MLFRYKAQQHGGEVHLLSNRPATTGGLPAEALLVLRMGALGSEEEMLKAAQLGYFQVWSCILALKAIVPSLSTLVTVDDCGLDRSAL